MKPSKASTGKRRALFLGAWQTRRVVAAVAEAGPFVIPVFLGLHCVADRAGRFEWNVDEIEHAILSPYRHDVDVRRLLDALVKSGAVIRYEGNVLDEASGKPLRSDDGKHIKADYGWIPTFLVGDAKGLDAQRPHAGEVELLPPCYDDPLKDVIWEPLESRLKPGRYLSRKTGEPVDVTFYCRRVVCRPASRLRKSASKKPKSPVEEAISIGRRAHETGDPDEGGITL